MAILPVKWFHSMMRGIPVITGQPGKMIAVLDACLVNGFGQTTSNTGVIVNKILTININNSETFLLHSVVAIEGISILNGEYRVIESTNNYIKVKVDLPNQTFSTAFTIKYAPLGWSKLTPSTPVNTALYIPKESYSGFNLYVNDTYSKCALVRLCKGSKNNSTLTNETNLIDPVPISTYTSMWSKSNSASTATRANFLIGDGSLFYYQFCKTNDINNYFNLMSGCVMVAGDIKRYSTSDNLAAVISCFSYSSSPDSFTSEGCPESMAYISNSKINNLNSGASVYRTFLGTSNNISGNDFAGRIPDGPFISFWSGRDSNYVEQSLKGQLELIKMLATSDRVIRGEYPGIYYFSDTLENVDDLTIEKGSGELNGKLLLLKKASSNISSYNESGYYSMLAYDLVGPWR